MDNPKPLAVLEAITPSRIGGAEVYVAQICEKLAHLGAHVDLFCPSGRPFVDYADRRGIGSVNWKTHGKFDPITVLRLARLIKKNRIDVIHTHLSTASLLGAFAAKLAGVPSVAHVHGMNSATCFKHSGLVIAVSEAVKKHLCAQGLDGSKIRVLHNGIDLTRFQPISKTEARSCLSYDSDAQIFGVFGRLSPEKGQKFAIEAMSIVIKDYPNARLILAGDGKDRADLESFAQTLGIAENVHFEGFIADPSRMMSACDAVIVPSIKEGFGLAAVEAMALGRPVVATDAGGLPEIIVNGETGFIVPTRDPQAIADLIKHLLEDKALAESMGKRGRERAEDCFDLDKQMKLLLSILRKVAGR